MQLSLDLPMCESVSDEFTPAQAAATAEQRSELATISAADRRKLAETIERARTEGKQLKVSIVTAR